MLRVRCKYRGQEEEITSGEGLCPLGLLFSDFIFPLFHFSVAKPLGKLSITRRPKMASEFQRWNGEIRKYETAPFRISISLPTYFPDCFHKMETIEKWRIFCREGQTLAFWADLRLWQNKKTTWSWNNIHPKMIPGIQPRGSVICLVLSLLSVPLYVSTSAVTSDIFFTSSASRMQRPLQPKLTSVFTEVASIHRKPMNPIAIHWDFCR